jgi:signal transduction histidine kinase
MATVMQHPVPEKLLVHIGDITVSFALVENSFQTLIGSLIAEHQRIGQIITAELAFRNLRALAISLYKERYGEDSDFPLLRDLARRAAELENTRNQVTHSLWGAGDMADTITRIKTTAKETHGIRFQFEQVRESDLARVAHELKLLAADVQSFWMKLLESGKALNNPVRKTWGTEHEAV